MTIVTQTRVAPGKDDAFAEWQQRMSAAVAAQAGFVKETVMPPSPPAQVDWVILQRFASQRSGDQRGSGPRERQRLVAEAQPMLVGQDDVHLVADARGRRIAGAGLRRDLDADQAGAGRRLPRMGAAHRRGASEVAGLSGLSASSRRSPASRTIG